MGYSGSRATPLLPMTSSRSAAKPAASVVRAALPFVFVFGTAALLLLFGQRLLATELAWPDPPKLHHGHAGSHALARPGVLPARDLLEPLCRVSDDPDDTAPFVLRRNLLRVRTVTGHLTRCGEADDRSASRGDDDRIPWRDHP